MFTSLLIFPALRNVYIIDNTSMLEISNRKRFLKGRLDILSSYILVIMVSRQPFS